MMKSIIHLGSQNSLGNDMKHNMIETLMGAIVIVIAAFFLIFAYSSSRVSAEDGYILKIKFDRIDGINVGSDVRLSGVKIGSVTKLFVDPKTYLANLEITLQSEIALPRDTSAEIISGGLLGDKYIALVPGGDEVFLKNGERIEHAQSSVSLEAMIGQLIFNKKNEQDDKK